MKHLVRLPEFIARWFICESEGRQACLWSHMASSWFWIRCLFWAKKFWSTQGLALPRPLPQPIPPATPNLRKQLSFFVFAPSGVSRNTFRGWGEDRLHPTPYSWKWKILYWFLWCIAFIDKAVDYSATVISCGSSATALDQPILILNGETKYTYFKVGKHCASECDQCS